MSEIKQGSKLTIEELKSLCDFDISTLSNL